MNVKLMAKNSLLLVAALVISLVLGEVLIRVVRPQQLVVLRPDIWEPIEGFGWRHRGNINTVVNTGEGPVHFRTDADGHRINIMAPDHEDEPSFRILVLGDSFAEAMQVENEVATAERLKRGLEERYAIRVRMDNTAVAGWDPNQYFLQAKASLAKYRYDLGIVFIFVGNDIVQGKRERFNPKDPDSRQWRLPNAFTRKEIIDAVLYPFNEMMERSSHLYVFWKNVSQRYLAWAGFTAYYLPEIFLKTEISSPRWRITAELCADIKAEFDKFSVPILFVLLPESSQVHQESFDRHLEFYDIEQAPIDLEQPNRLLSYEFAKRKLRFIDLLPELRRGGKEGIRMYGWIDTHLNENGHKAVAKAIMPLVELYLSRQ